MRGSYDSEPPTRAQIEALSGCTVLEFGRDDCGYCRAARPVIQSVLARHPDVRHLRVEDGRGRPLGRSYRVKLWPTLIFSSDGTEVARVVRPTDTEDLIAALDACLLAVSASCPAAAVLEKGPGDPGESPPGDPADSGAADRGRLELPRSGR